MIMRTYGLLFVIASLLGGLVGCSGDGAADRSNSGGLPELEVETVPVRRAQIHASLELVGTLLPIRATTIVSDVDGRIESFPASERVVEYEEGGRTQAVPLGLDIGHEVRQGDVLVQIDPLDFQLALGVAEANLALAKADLANLVSWKREEEIDQIRAHLKEAAAAAEQAAADLKRSEELLGKNAVSPATHGSFVVAAAAATAAKEDAEAALEIALQGPTPEQVQVAEAKVAVAEAEVALKQEKLDKTTIRSPYDGVVAERYVDVGDRVTAMPRVEIVQIIDPSALFAEVAVPEKYQAAIHLDDLGEVRAGGVGQPVAGRVDLLNVKIDPATRTFRARVTIDNRSRLLKAGGFVHVTLPLAGESDALVVPEEAISFVGGRHAVFVYADGRVQRRPVELGIADGRQQQVLSGVRDGERVVVKDISLLSDGLAVHLKTPPEAPARPDRSRTAGQGEPAPVASAVEVKP